VIADGVKNLVQVVTRAGVQLSAVSGRAHGSGLGISLKLYCRPGFRGLDGSQLGKAELRFFGSPLRLSVFEHYPTLLALKWEWVELLIKSSADSPLRAVPAA
jgi:hypothetical protein